MRPQFTREEFETVRKQANKHPPYSVKHWEVYLRHDLAKVFGDYPEKPIPLEDIFEFKE